MLRSVTALTFLAALGAVRIGSAQTPAPESTPEQAATPTPETTPAPSPSPTSTPFKGLTDLSLEELAQVNVEVMSVSRKSEPAGRAPAAVTILKQETIFRIGATSIPDAMRIAPGVHVAQIDASKWAVGIRGFGSRLSRSLLVLLDGRSVYSPLFAGTYWEMQDVVFEDIDRIEIVRGPGGALWGANAVNGVVNVVTKNASETTGAYGSGLIGSEEKGAVATRFGAKLGRNSYYRVWAKSFERDATWHSVGPAYDEFRMADGGFRADGEAGDAKWMVQGGAFRGEAGQATSFSTYSPPAIVTSYDPARFQGAHLLGRWEPRFRGDADAAVQIYADHTERREPHFSEIRDTVDVDLQHRFQLPGNNEIIYGAGYRFTRGVTQAVPTIGFEPPSRTDDLFSAFVQDQTSFFDDRLRFIVGTKLERNDYTGFELHPNVRLSIQPVPQQHVWVAASRALRTPSPVEADLKLDALVDPATPTYIRVIGNDDFRSEEVIALEAGYRADPTRRLRLTAAVFENRYRDLLSLEPGTPFDDGGDQIIPYRIDNKIQATTRGAEGGGRWTPIDRFSMFASASYLTIDAKKVEDSTDPSTVRNVEGGSPEWQASGGVTLLFPGNLSIDGVLRWVDELPAPDIDAYTEMDARLSWRMKRAVLLSLTGRNLLHDHHQEFAGGGEIERSVFARLEWNL